MRKRGSIFRVMAMVAVIMALFTSCSVGQSGKKAPDFTLTDLEGDRFTFSSTRGKVVILDFWATWCPPCRMEIPHFQELYEEYGDSGLEIVGVALDKGGASTVGPFAREMGITYPVVMGNTEVASLYGGVRAIPTTFIIDRDGVIVSKAVGYRDKAFFEEIIKELL